MIWTNNGPREAKTYDLVTMKTKDTPHFHLGIWLSPGDDEIARTIKIKTPSGEKISPSISDWVSKKSVMTK